MEVSVRRKQPHSNFTRAKLEKEYDPARLVSNRNLGDASPPKKSQYRQIKKEQEKVADLALQEVLQGKYISIDMNTRNNFHSTRFPIIKQDSFNKSASELGNELMSISQTKSLKPAMNQILTQKADQKDRFKKITIETTEALENISQSKQRFHSIFLERRQRTRVLSFHDPESRSLILNKREYPSSEHTKSILYHSPFKNSSAILTQASTSFANRQTPGWNSMVLASEHDGRDQPNIKIKKCVTEGNQSYVMEERNSLPIKRHRKMSRDPDWHRQRFREKQAKIMKAYPLRDLGWFLEKKLQELYKSLPM